MAPSYTKAAEVAHPEAQKLADLYGIEHDLSIASYLCGKVIELSEANSYDYPLMDGLVSAAIIRYGRCFASGVRMGLSKGDIAKLSDDNALLHDYFKNLRDKFIAHSVNYFEECYVTASVTVKDGIKLPLTSINAGYTRVVPALSEAVQLMHLVKQVREIVKNEIASEEVRLLSFLKSLPLEEVHSWDLHTPRSLKMTDAAKARKRGRNKSSTG